MSTAQPSPNQLVATALWTVSSSLIVALDERFGEPIDSYVNGSQVWLRVDGPNDITLEYRLHPIGGYQRPKGMRTDEVLSRVALGLATDEPAEVGFAALWEGLEVFVAFDDEGPLTPQQLAEIGEANLGQPSTACGMVDHEGIALRWQQSERTTSIVSELLAQLAWPN
jgi:hypothetical protein